MNKVKIRKIKPVHMDERGSITDLLNEKVNHIGLIITKNGCVRANHYHKLSTQYDYIISGRIEVSTAKSDRPSVVKKVILNPGELIIIPPLTVHKFKAIKNSVMIDIISKSRAGTGYEDDVVRVSF